MAALLALLVAVSPAPEAYVELQCPWRPIFFANGATELNEAARWALDAGGFLWFRTTEGAGVTLIVLRTHTMGEPASEVGHLSEARADAVRAALIERHIPADHIMISHSYSSEPRVVEEGWVGGWIYPEYYVTRAFRDRLFPPGANC
jgi:hypothetical protein